MELNQQKRLQELKKKYGYEIAVFKKVGDSPKLTDEEMLKSLLLLDIQNQLNDSINNYAEDVEFSDKELGALVSVLLNMAGEIIGNVARHNPQYILQCRNIAINLFDEHLKDVLHGPADE